MQYLSGGILKDRQDAGTGGRRAAMPVESLSSWLGDIAKALDFVHSRGYVHRDVKPANILFDQHGNAYLSDFGVVKGLAAEASRTETSALTGTGLVLGTPDYMAPEVILGQAFNGRADQYALGVMVHELLSGNLPFSASTPTAVLVLPELTAAPPSLGSLLSDIPKAVSDAVLCSLAKDPQQRYPSRMISPLRCCRRSNPRTASPTRDRSTRAKKPSGWLAPLSSLRCRPGFAAGLRVPSHPGCWRNSSVSLSRGSRSRDAGRRLRRTSRRSVLVLATLPWLVGRSHEVAPIFDPGSKLTPKPSEQTRVGEAAFAEAPPCSDPHWIRPRFAESLGRWEEAAKASEDSSHATAGDSLLRELAYASAAELRQLWEHHKGQDGD